MSTPFVLECTAVDLHVGRMGGEEAASDGVVKWFGVHGGGRQGSEPDWSPIKARDQGCANKSGGYARDKTASPLSGPACLG
jgi:hypothetical protein